MITIIGVKHDLQFEQRNIDPAAVVAQRQNLVQFRDLLDSLVKNDAVHVLGEEAGVGMILNEFIKTRYDCARTVLQELANARGLDYFQFDVPAENLTEFGIVPMLEDILAKRNRVPREIRERWFHKLIAERVNTDTNALVLVGLDHMEPLKVSLKDSAYDVICIDATKLDWYKDPAAEAMRGFLQ